MIRSVARLPPAEFTEITSPIHPKTPRPVSPTGTCEQQSGAQSAAQPRVGEPEFKQRRTPTVKLAGK